MTTAQGQTPPHRQQAGVAALLMGPEIGTLKVFSTAVLRRCSEAPPRREGCVRVCVQVRCSTSTQEVGCRQAPSVGRSAVA